MDFGYGNPTTDGSCDPRTATLPEVRSGLRDYSMAVLDERPRSPTPASQSLRQGSLITIRMQEICRSLSANYSRLLNEVVFVSGTTTGDDRKTVKPLKEHLKVLKRTQYFPSCGGNHHTLLTMSYHMMVMQNCLTRRH